MQDNVLAQVGVASRTCEFLFHSFLNYNEMKINENRSKSN